MHIVFLGNCQTAALCTIFDRFVGPHEPVTTEFIDAFTSNNRAGIARLRRAEIVVGQASLQPQPLGHEHIRAGAKLHLVPAVSGAFLYPYHGVVHPAMPQQRDGGTPFQEEFCDRFLARLYIAKVDAAEALRRYRAHDVAREARLGRVYEITLENQRELDLQTGYAVADLIETHLETEQLFQSAFHFSGRIARHLAAPLADRLGFHPKYGQRIRDFLLEAPFVRLCVPVHPSVAKFFGLRWARDDTRYPYRSEGSFTFDEYVTRFMQVTWSKALLEGIEDSRAGRPGAKAKLEIGLAEAPRSAEGAHELSRILEAEGDLAAAVALQKRAAGLAMDSYIPNRLAQLLRRAADAEGTEQACAKAVKLNPIGPEEWLAWSGALTALGRHQAARLAAKNAALFARSPAPARKAPTRQAVPILQMAELELQAHVQTKGDLMCDTDGWAGLPGSGLAIEGFLVLHPVRLPLPGLSYQAVLQDGSLSAPSGGNQYCGTRGQNTPICGLRITLDDELGARFAVAIEAVFIGGQRVQSKAVCRTEDLSFLEAFRVTFRELGAA